MKDYLLFIDTEASGLPKSWTAQYSKENNWPTAIQIAWVIFKRDGTEISFKNFYVNEPDTKIEASATKIHGITKQCLLEKGTYRKDVLAKLTSDVEAFDPVVIGHFMEFDYHVLAADFYRCQLQNPFDKAPMLCTMLATKGYEHNSNRNFLKLPKLYSLLFNETLFNEHNALVDARATARCFFKLYEQGFIDDKKIEEQNFKNIIESSRRRFGCSSLFLLFVMVTVIIFFL